MELEFGNVGFLMEGGKPENLEKNPRSKDENQQQTQPTYDTGTGNRTRATLVGGERSHHCAIPALLRKTLLKELSANKGEILYCTPSNPAKTEKKLTGALRQNKR